ncbi:MAG TPA: dihydrofolate reductase [Thermoanaerobaculia bacterium]|jgi:dihydrofolate reductase|nr:dihydrofolate reductase [Thermoanaerobaculia bacterium]
MRLSIIAALAANGVIGRDNRLPWRLSADLKRFKALTMGHHLVMGRKTFASIGRALPGRTTIIITHDEGFRADGVQVAHSIDEALALARDDDEVFIAGGAEIYRQVLHLADRMYLTRVHADVEGDVTFPEFDDVTEWRLDDVEHCEADEKNDYPFSFLVYDRAAPAGHAIAEN